MFLLIYGYVINYYMFPFYQVHLITKGDVYVPTKLRHLGGKPKTSG
jgi:hypothetical protein